MAHALFTVIVTFVLLLGTIGSAISSGLNGMLPSDLSRFSADYEVATYDVAGRVVAYSDGEAVYARFSGARVAEIVSARGILGDNSAKAVNIGATLTDTGIKLPGNLVSASVTVRLAGNDSLVTIELDRS